MKPFLHLLTALGIALDLWWIAQGMPMPSPPALDGPAPGWLLALATLLVLGLFLILISMAVAVVRSQVRP